MTARVPMEQRFLAKVGLPDANGCMTWQASLHHTGYGKLGRPGRGGGWVLAHRFSYEHFVGEIPEGLQIDHLCRNRACVAPNHLEPVTASVNVKRGLKGMRQEQCAKGHLLTADNTYLHQWRGKQHRSCKPCKRAYNQERYRRRVAA